MLRTKLAVLALCSLFAVGLLANPVAAASKPTKFRQVYNSILGTYTSLQHIAGAHNTYVKGKSGKACDAGQAHKWWQYKYRKDVSAVPNEEAKLSTVNNKQKHSRTYSDFVHAFDALVHWMNHSIEPRLLNCQQMPQDNLTFESDLHNLQADLGISTY